MMILTIHVSCVSNAFFYWVFCLYVLLSDESDSLDNESDKLGSDSRSSGTYYFCYFLWLLTSPLLVIWGLHFLTNRSRVQRWLTPCILLTLKFLIFFPNFKISFIVIVIVRICAHSISNWYGLSKNMIRQATMGYILRLSNSGSGVPETGAFI